MQISKMAKPRLGTYVVSHQGSSLMVSQLTYKEEAISACLTKRDSISKTQLGLSRFTVSGSA